MKIIKFKVNFSCQPKDNRNDIILTKEFYHVMQKSQSLYQFLNLSILMT